jgi:hypothetical protein
MQDAKSLARKVRCIAKQLSLPLKEEREKYSWDGKYIHTRNMDRSWYDGHSVLHDICHFQVASPTRRKTPEFGLGDSPDISSGAPVLLNDENAQREEEEASILTILWLRHIKEDHMFVWNDHSWGWNVSNSKIAKRTLRNLLKKGVVEKVAGKFIPVPRNWKD